MSFLVSPEVGTMIVMLGLAISLVSCILAYVHRKRAEQVVPLLIKFSFAYFSFIAIALMILIAAYLRSDFEFANVWENSSTQKPYFFKLSGAWGNHEGSMLLWLCIMAGYGVVMAQYLRRVSASVALIGLSGFFSIGFAVIGYIFFASSPFLRLSPTPVEGQDLNPVLQDLALIVHPPLLYMGTAGTVIVFVLGIAAAFQPSHWRDILLILNRFALWSWGFLTIGITLGSYWAYYELGWGGWWFWDPVENSSFLPWLILLALIHATKISIKKQEFYIATLVLALLPFVSVSFGTFLVRSGVLNSIHAFAVDPDRGLWLLGLFALSLIVFLFIIVFAQFQTVSSNWKMFSREGAIRLNVVFMGTIFGTVIAGVVYPLVLEAFTGHKISVGQPFYEAVIFPFAILMMILMAMTPILRWNGATILPNRRVMGAILVAGIFVFILTYEAVYEFEIQAQVFYILALMVICAAVLEGRKILTRSFSTWGMRLAHAGMGLAIIGAVFASYGKLETSQSLGQGDVLKIGGAELVLERLEQFRSPQYMALIAHIKILESGKPPDTVQAERRIYTVRQAQTTEVGLARRGLSQFYIAMGEVVDMNHVIIRAQYKPLIMVLWIGAILMALGGFVAALALLQPKTRKLKS